MGAFVGQVADHLCDYLCSPVDLLRTLVFHDAHGQHFLDRTLDKVLICPFASSTSGHLRSSLSH